MCIRVWFHAHSIKTLIISFFILWRGVTWLAGDIVYYFNKKLGYIYIYNHLHVANSNKHLLEKVIKHIHSVLIY